MQQGSSWLPRALRARLRVYLRIQAAGGSAAVTSWLSKSKSPWAVTSSQQMAQDTWPLRHGELHPARPGRSSRLLCPDLTGRIDYGHDYPQGRLGPRKMGTWIGCSPGSVCHRPHHSQYSGVYISTPFLSHAHLCIFNGSFYKLHMPQDVS